MLHGLLCFDSLAIDDEDRQRTAMYASERHRMAEQEQSGSLQDWLHSLQLEVGVEPLSSQNLTRIVQLLNKTNQMNLTTRRVTGSELLAWVEQGNRAVWALRVQDRFGDSGLAGIVSTEWDQGNDEARLVDFVLSCRVFGRQVERLMIHIATNHARSHGRKQLKALYLPTTKNKPTLDFLEASGLARDDENIYRWDLSALYPPPEFITVRQ
jgi:FkbH-like protein